MEQAENAAEAEAAASVPGLESAVSVQIVDL